MVLQPNLSNIFPFRLDLSDSSEDASPKKKSTKGNLVIVIGNINIFNLFFSFHIVRWCVTTAVRSTSLLQPLKCNYVEHVGHS